MLANIRSAKCNSPLVQLVERRTVNPYVAGSSPAGGAKFQKKDVPGRLFLYLNLAISRDCILLTSFPDSYWLRSLGTQIGTKTWLFNYTRPHNGKRANMTFGSYPSLSLNNARKKALGVIETLKRICQRVNEIMSFAQNKGLIEYNPLAKNSSAFLKPTVTNVKSISADELPELMRTLGRTSIMYTTRCMIEWQLHTMTRPIETAQARWDEIDWDENLWVIPADRMKKRRDHLVPLTPQTLNLLNEMKKINGGSEYIFASYKDPMRPSNSQTANIALKRIGLEDRLVSHGLRALASTTLNETKLFHNDVIELALAHVDKNQIRGIYNRALYLNQRREMLRWWSNYIEEASKGNFSICATS